MNFDNDVEIKKRALKLCEYYESWGLDCIEQYDKEVKSLKRVRNYYFDEYY